MSGIESGIELAGPLGGADEISRRLENLPGSPYLWRLVILLSLGGCFEIYDLFLTGYIAPGLNRSGLLTTTTQAFFGFSGIGAFVAAASMVIWILRLYVPESPLWLARHGRSEEAVKILVTLEGAGSTAPARQQRPANQPTARAAANVGYADLFKPPYLSLVALFMVFNFCQAFGFYGF